MNTQREFRIQTLQRLIDMDTNDVFSRYALALEYFNMPNWEMALSHFLFLKDHFSEYIPTYYQLAQLYEQLNEKDKAIETYKAGITKALLYKDMHALSELRSALQELEMDL